ncbi:unnamed protein product [Prunus armeniaca]
MRLCSEDNVGLLYVGERKLEKLDFIEETTDKVLEFTVSDWVFLKLSPWKGVMRLRKRGKLSPRYIGPYEIVERIGPVAYRLVLTESFRDR